MSKKELELLFAWYPVSSSAFPLYHFTALIKLEREIMNAFIAELLIQFEFEGRRLKSPLSKSVIVT